jgi:uncharacterized protein
MKKLAFITLVLLNTPFSLSAEVPWGKDADLALFERKEGKEIFINPKKAPWFSSLIHFHQQTISKSDGPRSHFYPGSSEYTRQSMLKYGFLKGFILGCDRLLRENSDDWIYPRRYIWKEWKKYDPVK